MVSNPSASRTASTSIATSPPPYRSASSPSCAPHAAVSFRSSRRLEKPDWKSAQSIAPDAPVPRVATATMSWLSVSDAMLAIGSLPIDPHVAAGAAGRDEHGLGRRRRIVRVRLDVVGDLELLAIGVGAVERHRNGAAQPRRVVVARRQVPEGRDLGVRARRRGCWVRRPGRLGTRTGARGERERDDGRHEGSHGRSVAERADHHDRTSVWSIDSGEPVPSAFTTIQRRAADHRPGVRTRSGSRPATRLDTHAAGAARAVVQASVVRAVDPDHPHLERIVATGRQPISGRRHVRDLACRRGTRRASAGPSGLSTRTC